METKSTQPRPVRSVPLILKKKNMTILKSNFMNKGPIASTAVKVATFREDVIFETTDVYFLKGEYQKLIIVNRMNVLTKQSRTIANYFTAHGTVVEKTSDNVTLVIGEEQYMTVFTALCSILDQDLKIRSILALLSCKSSTDQMDKISDSHKNDTVSKECPEFLIPKNICLNKLCQTDETRVEETKGNTRKRIRRQLRPYVIQDLKPPEPKKVKKVVINIMRKNDENSKFAVSCDKLFGEPNIQTNSNVTQTHQQMSAAVKDIPSKRNSIDSWPDLGHLHDEYSNDSIAFSTLSETTLPELLTNPGSILKDIDQHTKDTVDRYSVRLHYKYRLMDGSDMFLPSKPEDIFHIATKENLQYLDEFSKKKLVMHQMMIDYKHCLTVLDEDGNLPLHMAVLNNDLELLNRQCVVLKIRGSSVDIPANGLTPLKMSLYQEREASSALTSLLLRHGADPLYDDADHRTAVHIAAERDADILRIVLHTCSGNARRILYDNEDLWRPEMELQTDEELSPVLMKRMCSMFDKQGYTPLMLASMLGLYENVRILLEHSPLSVNDKMPTSGNTVLYVAVAAACDSAVERGNKSKVVDHFRKTIEILLEYGANPSIDNHCGTNVNVLLTEFSCAELSMLVANKMTQANLKNNLIPESATPFSKVMLVRDKQGKMEYKTLELNKKKKTDNVNQTIDNVKQTIDNVKHTIDNVKQTIDKQKPVIVENILLKQSGSSVVKSNSVVKATKSIDKSTKSKGVTSKKKILISLTKQRSQTGNKKSLILPSFLQQGTLKRKVYNGPKVLKQTQLDK